MSCQNTNYITVVTINKVYLENHYQYEQFKQKVFEMVKELEHRVDSVIDSSLVKKLCTYLFKLKLLWDDNEW